MNCDKCSSEIPNGQPYCTSNACLSVKVIRAEKNPKGGYQTWYEGAKYPLPFYPKQENLNYIDTLKRVVMASMRLIMGVPLTPRRLLLGLKTWLGDIYRADHGQHPERFKKEDFSEGSQEILEALIASDSQEDHEWAWYLTAIWDTDLAYGLRGKDILQNLDKSALRKNPKREIMRLAKIAEQREKGINEKLHMAIQFLRIALWFPAIKKQIVAFLEALDINKMQYTLEEKYWLANKFDHDYEGKTYDERMEWKNEEDKTYIPIELAPEKPRIQLLPPNQAFFDLPRKDAEQMGQQLKDLLIKQWEDYGNHKATEST